MGIEYILLDAKLKDRLEVKQINDYQSQGKTEWLSVETEEAGGTGHVQLFKILKFRDIT